MFKGILVKQENYSFLFSNKTFFIKLNFLLNEIGEKIAIKKFNRKTFFNKFKIIFNKLVQFY